MTSIATSPSDENLITYKARSSSSSSHRLSSAAASSASRKSKSIEPSTSAHLAEPRTSRSRPISVPWPDYRQQLAHTLAENPNNPPVSSSLPEESPSILASSTAPIGHAGATSNRSTKPNSATLAELRRASFSSTIFRSVAGTMSSQDGQQKPQQSPDSNENALAPSPAATTATSPVSVSSAQAGSTTASSSQALPSTDKSLPGPAQPIGQPTGNMSAAASARAASAPRQSRSRVSIRKPVNNRAGNVSPGSDRSGQASADSRENDPKRAPLGIIGVCALDAKARSKPSRNILNRINSKQEFEVIVFGDKIILDEEPENWPICNYLVSFFSEGFPLFKAIEYVRLRKPFCVNDLPMQMVLWDRRICLQILDRYEVRTPRRVEVTRDGGPKLESADIVQHIYNRTGLRVLLADDAPGKGAVAAKEVVMVDEDTLSVDGRTLKKPFVEKPVSGEDHNIYIYYSKEMGGGGRRLFRKINNKSSDADPSLNVPRAVTNKDSSFVYESFLSTQNHEDVKAYTVGSGFCHAETRKSPVVDGIVKRNTHGKEVRYVTSLTSEESRMAAKISEAFGQRVCGFDLLRAGNKSFVIDVNGWSFVKDNNDYYDRCSRILKDLFKEEKQRRESKETFMDGEGSMPQTSPEPASEPAGRPTAGHFATLRSILRSPSTSRLGSQRESRNEQRLKSQPTPEISAQTPTQATATSAAADVPADVNLGQSQLTVPNPAPQADDNALTKVKSPSEKEGPVPLPAARSQWKLKGMVSVIRHADRTPKQKWKFTFHTKPFVDLLKGHREEVLLVGDAALSSVMEAVDTAIVEGEEDREKLKLLRNTLSKKGGWPGTKVQIKPMFRRKKPTSLDQDPQSTEVTPTKSAKEQSSSSSDSKVEKQDSVGQNTAKARKNSVSGVTLSREAAAEDNLEIDKLQLIIKWGGEPTHSSRYQSQELGENMRNDLLLMNRDALEDLAIYSSSERRVTTSAQLWAASFLEQNEVPPEYIQIRKDLLDDSNAAKDVMDKVKKKLKELLRQGNKAPPQFAWPENMPEPYIVARNTVELMKFHRRVMRDNYGRLYSGGAASSLAAAAKSTKSGSSTSSSAAASPPAGALNQMQNINSVQNRWCCNEDAELFKERWEKLFDEFCDPEKIDPSKISELHDTMKFDALHNRQFLEWIFTPSQAMMDDFAPQEQAAKQSDSGNSNQTGAAPPQAQTSSEPTPAKEPPPMIRRESQQSSSRRATLTEKAPAFMNFRKRSQMIDPTTLRTSASDPATESYFNLFSSQTSGPRSSKSKTDARLEKLRELFLYSKILFDFIGPQEYGITNSEKLEIGLLTSLPLLRAIVNDLEDMQASEGAKTNVYFTKESHIYTLLNCIVEGGLPTKIERNKIPELDYLSTINFELYESQNPTETPGAGPTAGAGVIEGPSTSTATSPGFPESGSATASSTSPAASTKGVPAAGSSTLTLNSAPTSSTTSSSSPATSIKGTPVAATPSNPNPNPAPTPNNGATTTTTTTPVPAPPSFNHSIRITISPGCHTFEPLDVQLDSRHCIGFAQRRRLTAHEDWRKVVETLREKFTKVKLPRSFVAVDLSEVGFGEEEMQKGTKTEKGGEGDVAGGAADGEGKEEGEEVVKEGLDGETVVREGAETREGETLPVSVWAQE
ncbi:MAG: hypothetical protein M1831_007349 [Alyxoria varia]|nr:MAG: hypothetical protein M1831_007349 [Alyxoria varia]